MAQSWAGTTSHLSLTVALSEAGFPALGECLLTDDYRFWAGGAAPAQGYSEVMVRGKALRTVGAHFTR